MTTAPPTDNVYSALLESLEDVDHFINKLDSPADPLTIEIIANATDVHVLLVDGHGEVIRSIKLSLATEADYVTALTKISPSKSVLSGAYYDQDIGDVQDLDNLLCLRAAGGFNDFKFNDVYDAYFNHELGRGKDMTAPTKSKVVLESCGRCMFEGCGEKLTTDDLTGYDGNYRYLAHIVASSKKGPRGNDRSKLLSNEPSNIMMLCDKHHRLIDRVAVRDYPEVRLKDMKMRFLSEVALLLEHMAYPVADTYVAFWPIGGHFPARPTQKEQAISLRHLHCRQDIQLQQLTTHSGPFEIDNAWWENRAAPELKTLKYRFEAMVRLDKIIGIYALGPMAMLIGLGAAIGNKSGLHAIPRSRELNEWIWRRDQEDPMIDLEVTNLELSSRQAEEAVLLVALTDIPAEVACLVERLATDGRLVATLTIPSPNNDAIAHLQEANAFREKVHGLLHHLRNQHGVKMVHLLPCCSNVAGVEIGRAIEHFHPNVRVYDHGGVAGVKTMIPRLDLMPDKNEVLINAVPASVRDAFIEQYVS